MPRIRTEIVRPKGINKDLSPYELPQDVWSDGDNVTFRRYRANKAEGYDDIFAATYTDKPTFLQYFTDGQSNKFLMMDFGNAYTIQGATETLVGSSFKASREASWTGCNLNGVTVVNNRNDHPQVLNPDTFAEMVDLPNWDSPLPEDVREALDPETAAELDIWGEASRCEVIRPYKNFLIALDCYDQNGVRYPEMIRWSNGAAAGDVPDSWNPQDAGDRAGLYSLSDTPGRCLDGLTLGDYFIVYKSDSVWTMQFIGGELTMSFRKLFGTEGGALSKECIVDFEGQHFVLTPDGAYVHNGASRQEIMEKWVKDELFENVSPTYKLQTKVVADHPNKEIWIYYTSKDATTEWADRALIWNWDTQLWSTRDLTGISYIAQGRIDPDAPNYPSWDETVGSWDDQTDFWDNGVKPLNAVPFKLLLGDYVNNKLYVNEVGVQTLGVDVVGFVERIGLDFDDDRVMKYVSRIVPHVRNQTEVSAPVTIKIYAEEVITESPTEEATIVFTPGVDHDIDCHVVGRWIGVRFEGTELWELTGFTIEWEPAGQF